MKKLLLVFILFGFLTTLLTSEVANAATLRIAPLQYRTTLKKGETKKGFVDVNNPSNTTVRIVTQVQAFTQIDNNGGLQFYDNEQVAQGIKPDLSTFDLGAKETLRLYFSVDGTKLPV